MPSPHALQVRQNLRQQADAFGINTNFISDLVDTFYERIRAHPRLGPIFETAIAPEAWPTHLATMKAFWASVLLHTGDYSGRPMAKHMALKALEPAHFGEWLYLFEQTVRDLNPHDEAVAFVMEKAWRIGESMKQALAYR